MALQIAAFVAGLVLLVTGGNALVRGSSSIAARLGISPLVVGLTVVAWGTSAPELAVSLGAALRGLGDMALGNVVGSNIVNILVVLGVSALVAPLAVSRRLVRLDVPILVALSFGVWGFALDRRIGRIEGVVLLAAAVLYTWFAVRVSRGDPSPGSAAKPTGTALSDVGRIVLGLVLLTLGSQALVWSATAFARALGVSELVIGLTIVALGTSLPEMAASIIAAFRGERELAVGNAIGSNIFNIVAVLGLTAVASPAGVPVADAALAFDIPVMVAVAVACLPVFFAQRVGRPAGALFIGYYSAYTLYLILAAGHHDLLPLFSRTMAVFVIPLTVLVLAVVTWREVRARRRAAAGAAVASGPEG
jgi:cation:H+ antiporter